MDFSTSVLPRFTSLDIEFLWWPEKSLFVSAEYLNHDKVADSIKREQYQKSIKRDHILPQYTSHDSCIPQRRRRQQALFQSYKVLSTYSWGQQFCIAFGIVLPLINWCISAGFNVILPTLMTVWGHDGNCNDTQYDLRVGPYQSGLIIMHQYRW